MQVLSVFAKSGPYFAVLLGGIGVVWFMIAFVRLRRILGNVETARREQRLNLGTRIIELSKEIAHIDQTDVIYDQEMVKLKEMIQQFKKEQEDEGPYSPIEKKIRREAFNPQALTKEEEKYDKTDRVSQARSLWS